MAGGIYYMHVAYSQNYRDKLQANPVTMHWNLVLRLGVAAKSIVVIVIGGLFIYAAMQSDASGAGGMGKVFDWVQSQPFGKILVTAMCIGLLAYALFCFVNAAYRVVPKAAGDDTETVTAHIKAALS